MTPAQAQQILESLSNGIDPESGEVLPEDSPVNNPQVIRALFVAIRSLQAMTGASKAPHTAPKAPKVLPGKAGKPWSGDEDQRLLAAFDAGKQPAALAKDHDRTNGAIQARLVRLGRLNDDSAAAK